MAIENKQTETKPESKQTESRARPVPERLREMRGQVLRMAADNLDPPELHEQLLTTARQLQMTELTARQPQGEATQTE